MVFGDFYRDSCVNLIWIIMMDQFTLEEDDMGMFITQTANENMENISSLLDESFDFESNEVGSMHYSDISDDEGSRPENVWILLRHLPCKF